MEIPRHLQGDSLLRTIMPPFGFSLGGTWGPGKNADHSRTTRTLGGTTVGTMSMHGTLAIISRFNMTTILAFRNTLRFKTKPFPFAHRRQNSTRTTVDGHPNKSLSSCLIGAIAASNTALQATWRAKEQIWSKQM